MARAISGEPTGALVYTAAACGGMLLVIWIGMSWATLNRGVTAASVSTWLYFQAAVPFYLIAIWQAARTFARIERGGGLHDGTARLVVSIGGALLAGAAVQVAGATLLARAIRGGTGPVFHHDPAAITLGVLGLLLILFGRVVRRGAAIESELETFV